LKKFFTGAFSRSGNAECYENVMRRIRKRNATMRTLWAAAASLLIAATSVLYLELSKNQAVPMKSLKNCKAFKAM